MGITLYPFLKTTRPGGLICWSVLLYSPRN